MENNFENVRVLVVDDHAVMRVGVAEVLRDAGMDVVGDVGCADDALAAVATHAPEVAVVDVRLGSEDGIALVGEIRRRHPGTHCLTFTHLSGEDTFRRSVLAGATGYVVKDVPSAELVDAVRTVASGRSVVRGHRVGGQDGHREPVKEVDDGRLSQLTPQERRILDYASRGLMNREIAEELSLAEKTVRNYMSNALGKAGLRNRTEAAAYLNRRNALAEHRDRQRTVA